MSTEIHNELAEEQNILEVAKLIEANETLTNTTHVQEILEAYRFVLSKDFETLMKICEAVERHTDLISLDINHSSSFYKDNISKLKTFGRQVFCLSIFSFTLYPLYVINK